MNAVAPGPTATKMVAENPGDDIVVLCDGRSMDGGT